MFTFYPCSLTICQTTLVSVAPRQPPPFLSTPLLSSDGAVPFPDLSNQSATDLSNHSAARRLIMVSLQSPESFFFSLPVFLSLYGTHTFSFCCLCCNWYGSAGPVHLRRRAETNCSPSCLLTFLPTILALFQMPSQLYVHRPLCPNVHPFLQTSVHLCPPSSAPSVVLSIRPLLRPFAFMSIWATRKKQKQVRE